ncbi:MAG: glycosyltransferase [Acidobacteria bacterium]|nr:glycosyltransferase [Acidobacteriota bacterium]
MTSGIAQYSQEVLPALASSYAIDTFVEGPAGRFAQAAADVAVFSAHDFIWKHAREPYDLIVYQLGNAPCHDYMWAYLVRYPGLVVLHDGQLHHARARWLLQQKRDDDYRSEFRFNHPDANVDLAEMGVTGLLGSLTYLWPMLRIVVESARFIVAHNQWLADQIREVHADARIEVVEMGVPAPVVHADASERIRTRHGIPADAVLFTAFGKVTPEKRISEAIRGLASVAGSVPKVHLLLAGEAVDYYDPDEEASRLGISHLVTVAGFVPEEEIGDYLAASDVCLCMRWPSARETSASWLRCLASGRPTITTDLVHTVDIPALDPRTWTTRQPSEPVSVSIDILDEDHSLKLAMRRLATDHRLRAALGRSAHDLWERRFRIENMVSRYRDVIDAACAARPPDAAARAHLPAHLAADGTGHARLLLRQVGLAKKLVALFGA